MVIMIPFHFYGHLWIYENSGGDRFDNPFLPILILISELYTLIMVLIFTISRYI